jgi:hypothetical protein
MEAAHHARLPETGSPEIAPAILTHRDVGNVRGCREHPWTGIRAIHGLARRKLLLHF